MPVIMLDGNSYIIDLTPADRIRRTLYFRNGSRPLTPDERRLLDDLGIDPIMEQTLRTELPDFFNQLPACQSNTNLVLSKNCEIPHFVLWSILFHATTQTQRRILANRKRHRTVSGLGTATTGVMTGALNPGTPRPAAVADLFRLIVPGSMLPPGAPGTPSGGIGGLFHVLAKSP